MKIYSLVLTLLLLLTGCNSNNSPKSNTSGDSTSHSSVGPTAKTVPTDTVKERVRPVVEEKYTITGFATYSFPYCGGAAPSKQMMEESRKKKPFTLSTIALVHKESKVKSQVKTNSKGEFSVELKPGKYDYYVTKEINENLGIEFEPTCDKTVWLYGQFEVCASCKMKVFPVFEFSCNHCLPPRP